MEFYRHIETSKGKIWIVDAFENGFIKSEESRQEYEARFLEVMLQKYLGDVQLIHESNGAPLFKNRSGLNISISHSVNWFAIYVSEEENIGIDIEIHSERIKRIANYFLTEKEVDLLQPTTEQLRVCWGVKESVFKLYRGKIKSILNEIEVVSIEKNQAIAKCENRKIRLAYQQEELFTLVFTD